MMKKPISALAFAVAFLGLSSLAQDSQPANDTATAAQTFLATLDAAQRAKATYDFKDAAQRKNWSNLPTSFVKRGGLRLGDLTQAQRDAAMSVVESALSPQGYAKIQEIVEGDEYLKTHNNNGGRRPPPAGPPSGQAQQPSGQGTAGGGPPASPKGPGRQGGAPMFGHDEYYISFLGQPSATAPWMIQFGGHHLAINITLVGTHGTLAPSHTAAQPAIYELEGKTVRPLGDETDKAFALLSSLNEAQRKQAVLGFEMHDLVLGPGRDGQTIQPEGIQGSALTDKQRELLLDLASEWTAIQSDAFAKAKMEEMKKHIEDTWFAWSGPVEKGGAAYFRIQGPTVLIEYAPQTLGGDPTKHIHTIYRDPTNEYGAQWWKP
ncbi:DUF3500 domain-containing protein [Prosthecobacter sp.]|uniref:DUF3500 domain-containing protein n=1 Tax=Prosthecobacter sp. TaxID=1965333 RepID=UPI0037847E1C